MKKLLMAAISASMALGSVAATPAFAASRFDHRYEQSQNRYEQGHDRYGNNFNRQQYRNWKRGERFDRRYASNYRVISNPGYYHLRPAPRGYHWVRSGNDAVLVALTTGLIASIFANSF